MMRYEKFGSECNTQQEWEQHVDFVFGKIETDIYGMPLKNRLKK
jgi:hypothetical protein